MLRAVPLVLLLTGLAWGQQTGGAAFDTKPVDRIRCDGVDLARRSRVNFLSGANVTLTCQDDPSTGETEVSIASTGGGGGGTTTSSTTSTSSSTSSTSTVTTTSTSSTIDFCSETAGCGYGVGTVTEIACGTGLVCDPDPITGVGSIELATTTSTSTTTSSSTSSTSTVTTTSTSSTSTSTSIPVFRTMDAPSGTDPVASLVNDTLTFLAGTGLSITGSSGAKSLTFALVTTTTTSSSTTTSTSTTSTTVYAFKTIDASSGTDPVADQVDDTLTVTGTAPMTVTGNSGTDTLTLSITDAAADGSTKGIATFTAADFNASSGNISLDYTNGQAAASGVKGFLTAADWATFNAKVGGSGTSSYVTYWSGTSTVTGEAAFAYDASTDTLTVPTAQGTTGTGGNMTVRSNGASPPDGTLTLDSNIDLLTTAAPVSSRGLLRFNRTLTSSIEPIYFAEYAPAWTRSSATGQSMSLLRIAGTVTSNTDVDYLGLNLGRAFDVHTGIYFGTTFDNGGFEMPPTGPVQLFLASPTFKWTADAQTADGADADTAGEKMGLHSFLQTAATYQSTSANVDADMTGVFSVRDGTVYHALGSTTTLDVDAHRGLGFFPIFDAQGTSSAVSCQEVTALYVQPGFREGNNNLGGTGTLPAIRGMWFKDFDDNAGVSAAETDGAIFTEVTAVDIDDLATYFEEGATTVLSLRSADPDVQMRHAGPIRVGANAAPTAGTIADFTTSTTAVGTRITNQTYANRPTCAAGILGTVFYCTDCNSSCSAGSSNGRFCGCSNQSGSAAWQPMS